MSRQIIILASPPTGNPDLVQMSGVFWLNIKRSDYRYHVNPDATSIVPDITTAELDMIRTGKTKEQQFFVHYRSDATTAEMTSDLESQFDAAQLLIANDPSFQWSLVYMDNGKQWWQPTTPPTPIEIPVINPLASAPESPPVGPTILDGPSIPSQV